MSAPAEPNVPSSEEDGIPAADPPEAGPDPTGNPVDPAIATSTPDPGQTGRDER